MREETAVITDCDIRTAYGRGLACCWEGLWEGRTAIRPCTRFDTGHFPSRMAAVVDGIGYGGRSSLAARMLIPLLESSKPLVPCDAVPVLASTTGEIDLLEKNVLEGTGDAAESRLDVFLEKVKAAAGIKGGGFVVSGACASSSAALGFAAGLIQNGKHDCVLVAAVDAVTEFVFSGFSSLMALDPEPAKPFDRQRAGLSLGDGAGFILLMSCSRAQREGRAILGEISGWAMTADANHMTGPSRDGDGLKRAIQKALDRACVSDGDIGVISSHGTGTVYNDSMEMKAYTAVFGRPVPLYSIKGAVGHTMGAAGLIETAIALRVLRERVIPATIGLRDADPEAKNWVSSEKRKLEKSVVLLNNSGFGGVNAALVLRQPYAERQ
ncbi:MAG: beta-ketoacyl synthase N-terminal-like domain-containing protein [Candidatus Omnitrophica bacterium]|nr:beta-ketoacyl synthase N-terminal-like domain-containing protein [Candidatus Omnitrophota bacterium]